MRRLVGAAAIRAASAAPDDWTLVRPMAWGALNDAAASGGGGSRTATLSALGEILLCAICGGGGGPGSG